MTKKSLFAQARRHAKVERHATNQKTRRQTRVFEQPGEHAARRGLAMGACDSQHPAICKHVLGQPLRSGLIGLSPRSSTASTAGLPRDKRIADHNQGIIRQLRRVIALMQGDARGGKLIAHRWVDVGCRSR
jgi:hypothetical protein